MILLHAAFNGEPAKLNTAPNLIAKNDRSRPMRTPASDGGNVTAVPSFEYVHILSQNAAWPSRQTATKFALTSFQLKAEIRH
jgi:hypothetical protein